MNSTRYYHRFILLVLVAFLGVQCDTSYYEKYRNQEQKQQPNVKDTETNVAQSPSPAPLPNNKYYIQLTTIKTQEEARKEAQQYKNNGHIPLMFKTSDSTWIVTIGAGKYRPTAKRELNLLVLNKQIPDDAKLIQPKDTWIGPLPLEIPPAQKKFSDTPNPYVTVIPGAERASENPESAVTPAADTTRKKDMPPEPKIYDVTQGTQTAEDQKDETAAPKQSIYDMVRGFFNPASDDKRTQPVLPEKYHLVAGTTNSLTSAKRIGEGYVLKGLPVFIWENENGEYSIVIGEADTQENCENRRQELIENNQITDATVVVHSEQWLKKVFP